MSGVSEKYSVSAFVTPWEGKSRVHAGVCAYLNRRTSRSRLWLAFLRLSKWVPCSSTVRSNTFEFVLSSINLNVNESG
jgi:hypothetical protein